MLDPLFERVMETLLLMGLGVIGQAGRLSVFFFSFFSV